MENISVINGTKGGGGGLTGWQKFGLPPSANSRRHVSKLVVLTLAWSCWWGRKGGREGGEKGGGMKEGRMGETEREHERQGGKGTTKSLMSQNEAYKNCKTYYSCSLAE